jgi:hypothetical protein
MFVNAVVFMLLQSANEGKMNNLVFSFKNYFEYFLLDVQCQKVSKYSCQG